MIDDPLNRLKVKRGENLPQSKLGDEDVEFILLAVQQRELLREEASLLSNNRLAEKFGIHVRTIDRITAGYSWTHIGGWHEG